MGKAINAEITNLNKPNHWQVEKYWFCGL